MELPDIQKIHQLLAAKDDTSRFVGLLLLKSTLDNHSSELRYDQVEALWDSISPKFLDRLLRTGSQPASEERKQSKDMLDVAVAVVYTFTKLLNDCALKEKFYRRIPNMANAVLYSSEETTRRIVGVIHVLVQQPDGSAMGGATCFAELEVSYWAPLIEIAPQHNNVFSIFHWAWVKGSITVPAENMTTKIDEALQLFLSSFKGHNPTPLLEFITLILENLNPTLRSPNPKWLKSVTRLIHDMASSKQTVDGRRAYTHCAAALLGAYPEKAPRILFSDDPSSSKPIAYLFVKMLQVDIQSTIHILIPKLNTAEYLSISHRISAALDIMTSFVGFLIAAADDSSAWQSLSPDRILKLHEDLVRTVGDVIEYLRDRWDAFLAGSRGIELVQALEMSVFEDPITPAAIRLIATWLRDDDGETLRLQAAGLVDMFAELYKMNMTSTDIAELRLPILAALEGILQTSNGHKAFESSGFWSRCLFPDLRVILASYYADLTIVDYVRGSAILHTFHAVMEYKESPHSNAVSMDLVQAIANLALPPIKGVANDLYRASLGFQTDAIELAITLSGNLPSDVQSSYQVKNQQIKTTLKNAALKVKEHWTALNDEHMVVRMEELLVY
ncbi:DUF1941-domain-containing protein [Xylariaceae sp. FL1651]|nr:DUF1941-domain-containing protein [Xylariaceae sp. FL1651]